MLPGPCKLWTLSPQEVSLQALCCACWAHLQHAADVLAGLQVMSQLGYASFCFCCARACESLTAYLKSAHAGVPLVGLPGRGRAEGSGLLAGLAIDFRGRGSLSATAA